MKTRNRTVCETCRSRKLGCDGLRPACSQCTHTGRSCQYPSDFIFVSDTAPRGLKDATKPFVAKTNTSGRAGLSRRPRPKSSVVPDPLHVTLSNPVQHMVLLIMQNYMPEAEILAHPKTKPEQPRICGNWVEVLPMLSIGGQGHALPSAISCLAASVSHFRRNSYSTHAVLLGKYGLAMRSLKNELEQPRDEVSSRDEVATAIMCLTLTEMIRPTSTTGWWRHVDGVGEWMRLSPPESFSLGIRHRLFTGFRPLLILKAFSSRKATFLSSEDWKRQPFEFQHALPMQLLFSEASSIPTILELIDTLEHSPSHAAAFIATEAISSLIKTYDCLQAWGDPMDANLSQDLRCWRIPARSSWAWDSCNIWFPSLPVANLLMHLWAFKAVCLVEIRQLRTRFPNVACDWPVPVGCELDNYLREASIELCIRIIQSAQFLLQDQLALFGPLSLAFPLTAACQTFEIDGERSEALWELTTGILQGSLLSGLPLGAHLFHK